MEKTQVKVKYRRAEDTNAGDLLTIHANTTWSRRTFKKITYKRGQYVGALLNSQLEEKNVWFIRVDLTEKQREKRFDRETANVSTIPTVKLVTSTSMSKRSWLFRSLNSVETLDRNLKELTARKAHFCRTCHEVTMHVSTRTEWSIASIDAIAMQGLFAVSLLLPTPSFGQCFIVCFLIYGVVFFSCHFLFLVGNITNVILL